MGRLEKALNPSRRRADNPALGSVGVSSPYGERHVLVLTRALKEICDGFSAILAHWGIERYWGHSGCAFASAGVVSTGVPGEHFEVPEHGYSPLPRRLFSAIDLAVKELAECIRTAETAERAIPARPAADPMMPAMPLPPASPPAHAGSKKSPTLRELIDALTNHERGSKATGPFVRNMNGQPVDGWSEIQGQMAHGVSLGCLRLEIESMEGFKELRTFALRVWDQDLTVTVCRRIVGELLRRCPDIATAEEAEAFTIREAVKRLNSPMLADPQELGTEILRRGGRSALSGSKKAQTKALHNLYMLIRTAKEANSSWGKKTLQKHFKTNKDFHDLVKEAGLKFELKLFHAALVWISRNPSGHRIQPQNVS
jgi:hypothetical protein